MSAAAAGEAIVLSHFGRTNSFGLMTILEISPNPELVMIVCSSSLVIFPNALGIHNAGYSYSCSGNSWCMLLLIMAMMMTYVINNVRVIAYNINQFFC